MWRAVVTGPAKRQLGIHARAPNGRAVELATIHGSNPAVDNDCRWPQLDRQRERSQSLAIHSPGTRLPVVRYIGLFQNNSRQFPLLSIAFRTFDI
jgi:hypothetical protein